jgi:hypothetical protein
MGGGGGASAPSSQRVEQTSIPSYAQPYVENMLGQAAALTDISQNPYQVYGGQRLAGFSPLQTQAFERIANQQVAPQIGQATTQAQGLAPTALGYGALGAGIGAQGVGAAQQGFGAGQAYQTAATSPAAIQAYMSPYMQNVVDYQKQQAIRDFQKQAPTMQAQAVGQGAFGGNRLALQQSEANRALQNQLAGIQATGSQDAFRQAQQAQQFGAQLGLQGLQAGYQGLGVGLQGAQTGLQGVSGAAQGASLLGNLGQTQFGQETAISDAQLRAGALQQALRQQGLDIGYQDFLKQRNYPYQQLAFMSDMFRGLPLSQSAQQVYTAPPSMASQIGGLGMTGLGIYGMSGGFKGAKGGLMDAKGYKDGGVVGYSIGGDISMMPTDQLRELLDNPNLSPMEVAQIEKMLMLRDRIESNPESQNILGGGLDTVPSGDMFEAAGGGIVAFASGSKKAIEDKSAAYEDLLMEDIKRRQKMLEQGNPYAQAEAEEAKIREDLKKSSETAPYRALAMTGLGTMAGTSQNPLTNLGLGGIEGLKSYAQAMREQDEGKKLLLQQAGEREKSKFSRETALLGSQQTALGQLLGRRSAAETAAAARADTATKNRQLDLTRAQNAYTQLYNNAYDELSKSAKPGGINYKKYKDDPEALKRDARNTALGELSPDLRTMLGFQNTQAAPGTTAPAVPVRVPPKAAVQQLKNMDTAETRAQFDAIFGPGAAQRALSK